ncbi:MAG TPA: ABC transporter permease [Bryobacteraceae bacterium]|nr:ABC transporter permease [Bryobacteraceae bacterium]
MWERILQIIRKEFITVFRDPRLRTTILIPPLLQLIIYGYTVNLDIEHGLIAWMDLDHTPASRDLLAGFEGSSRFRVVAAPVSEAEVQKLMDAGDVQAVVRVLPNFERHIRRGEPAPVQILVDGANSNTASLLSGYISSAIAGYAEKTLATQQGVMVMSRSPTSPPNVSAPNLVARPRVWFNPDLKSRNYFIPGVVVNIIMIVTLALTAQAIVREKEMGTMEQLLVTPIRPIEIILGKTLPFAAIGLFDVVLVISAAELIFQVPLHGSALLLLGSSILFLLTTLGAGLFISTISRSQQQAMLSTFFFAAPAFMLSGFAFPIRNMPVAVQYLTLLDPLRYFIQIVRGIFLKGAGVDLLWRDMAALLAYGVAILGLSAMRFRKRLD